MTKISMAVRKAASNGSLLAGTPLNLRRALIFAYIALMLAANVCLEAQLLETYSFTGLNRPLPDGNTSGIQDVRVISSAISHISSVKVRLRVAGEYNGDLYAYVRCIQPGITNFCVLLNRPGRTALNPYGYDDEGLDITFDDLAANGDIHVYETVTDLPYGSPLTGAWQPDGRLVDPLVVLDTTPRTAALTNFSNANGSGEWTLYLADCDSGGTNMLSEWDLELAGAVQPQIAWPAPAPITYGTALAGAQLNATVTFAGTNIPGTFNYSPPAGTLLDAGTGQLLSVTFTPSDPNTFLPVSASTTLNVIQALAGKLVFTTLPVTTMAGVASGVITVQRQDAFDNPATNGATAVTLTSSSTGAKFYSADGTTQITSASILDNQTSASFLYADTVAGNPTITNSASGLTSASQQEIVIPAAANAYRITDAACGSPAAGVGDQLTITLVDQFGNTEVGFNGNRNLAFSGLSTAGDGTLPTVTDKDGAAQNETNSTAITFTSGVSSGGGMLKAYKAQTQTLNATDGTLSSTATGGAGVNLTIANAAPVANDMTVTRAAGTLVAVAKSDLAAHWSDANHDVIMLASVSATSTNSQSVTSNATFIVYPSSAPNVNDQISYTISDGTAPPVTGHVNLTVMAFVQTGQSIAPIVGGNSVTLKFYGIANLTYITQRSTNMTDYVNIHTNTVGANGAPFTVTDNFSDLGGNKPSSAYYRLKYSP